MLENLPSYIAWFFALTTAATLLLFIQAIKKAGYSRKTIVILFLVLIIWLLVQGTVSMAGNYKSDIESFPPKILLFGIVPAMFTIFLLFVLPAGRRFIDRLPLRNLTYIHVIRIPVEFVLFWLYLHHAVPELMTFEGRNWDIAAGISAPFVTYFYFVKNALNKTVLLIWNILCLCLLLNIVIHALLSTPSPIQLFAFDQPNWAILNFPFSWLPVFVVPVVLFSHLVAIRKLLLQK